MSIDLEGMEKRHTECAKVNGIYPDLNWNRGFGQDAHKDRAALLPELRRLRSERDALRAALEPFSYPGGGCDMQAYHDLEDDVVVWENSGKAVTAGDVRTARRVLAKVAGKPVSEMHCRRALSAPQAQGGEG